MGNNNTNNLLLLARRYAVSFFSFFVFLFISVKMKSMTWAFIVVAMLVAIAYAVPVERDDSEEDLDNALMDRAKREALLRQDKFIDAVWRGLKVVTGKNKAKLADIPADESSHLDRNRREISAGN